MTSVTDAPLELFPTCPVQGCRNPVDDPRVPCGECQAAFGPRLQRTGAVTTIEEFTVAVEAADARVARVMAERYAPDAMQAETTSPELPQALPDEWRRNQLCWCCEGRRTCRIAPGSMNGWICKTCLEIQ